MDIFVLLRTLVKYIDSQSYPRMRPRLARASVGSLPKGERAVKLDFLPTGMFQEKESQQRDLH